MSDTADCESSWGPIRVHEPEPGLVVFEAMAAPEPPAVPGEPRTVVEAFTLWQEREGARSRSRR